MNPAPVKFAIIDLSNGWLDTRLFLLAALLDRVRGASSFVFVDESSSYVGIADIHAVRWSLARERTDLEAALLASLATTFSGWWPLVDEGLPPPGMLGEGPNQPSTPEQVHEFGHATISSSTGTIKPDHMLGQVLHRFLHVLRIRPPTGPHPPPGWVELHTAEGESYWEHAAWISQARLRTLLDRALVVTALQESTTGSVDLEKVIRWGGPVVPVIDNRGAFVRGIDREATAATLGTQRR